MSGIHAEVLEVRAESRTWEELEGRLLERYGLDDALRLLKRDFMEWVETPDKGSVGKHVPPDGRYREPADLRTGPDRFRPIEKDTYANMPKSHIGINTT